MHTAQKTNGHFPQHTSADQQHAGPTEYRIVRPLSSLMRTDRSASKPKQWHLLPEFSSFTESERTNTLFFHLVGTYEDEELLTDSEPVLEPMVHAASSAPRNHTPVTEYLHDASKKAHAPKSSTCVTFKRPSILAPISHLRDQMQRRPLCVKDKSRTIVLYDNIFMKHKTAQVPDIPAHTTRSRCRQPIQCF